MPSKPLNLRHFSIAKALNFIRFINEYVRVKRGKSLVSALMGADPSRVKFGSFEDTWYASSC